MVRASRNHCSHTLRCSVNFDQAASQTGSMGLFDMTT